MFKKIYVSVMLILLTGCAQQSQKASEIRLGVRSRDGNITYMSAPLEANKIQFVNKQNLITLTFHVNNDVVVGDLVQKMVCGNTLTSKATEGTLSYQSISYKCEQNGNEIKKRFVIKPKIESKVKIEINDYSYSVEIR